MRSGETMATLAKQNNKFVDSLNANTKLKERVDDH